MAHLLLPGFDGLYKPERLSPKLLENLAQRVRAKKVFPWATARRNQYVIAEESHQKLRYRATSLLTGAFVGLNDVTLRTDKTPGAVHYSVKYWLWAGYCIGLGLVIAAAILVSTALFQFAGSKANVHAYPWVFWGSLLFWCFVWPWVLIALHKIWARKMMVRLLDEVNRE